MKKLRNRGFIDCIRDAQEFERAFIFPEDGDGGAEDRGSDRLGESKAQHTVTDVLLSARRDGWWDGLMVVMHWLRDVPAVIETDHPRDVDEEPLAFDPPSEQADEAEDDPVIDDPGLYLIQLRRRRADLREILNPNNLPRTAKYLERASALNGLDAARREMARIEKELAQTERDIRRLERGPAVPPIGLATTAFSSGESTAALAGPRGPLN